MIKLDVTPVNDIDAFERRLYTDEPQPCLLLRDDLAESTYIDLVRSFVVFHLEHEGEMRDVLLFGVYQPGTVVELDKHQRMEALSTGEGNWEFIVEHPDATGVLLSANLTTTQREKIHAVFEIEDVEIEGEPREQIQVVWFTPRFRKRED